jgi:hypothetical protein
MQSFAAAIAYSQGARSKAIGDLIHQPIFHQAFADFFPSRLSSTPPGDILTTYWNKLRAMRFQSKVSAIVGCACVLVEIEGNHGSFRNYLLNFKIPRRIDSREGIVQFWSGFDELQADMRLRGMPFFRSTTSLLQLLLDLDYDSVKPDLIVMRLARRLGMVAKETGDRNFRTVVRMLQEYAVDRHIRVAALDWYMLAFGGQTEAVSYLTNRFCAGPGSCSNDACLIGGQRLCFDYNRNA